MLPYIVLFIFLAITQLYYGYVNAYRDEYARVRIDKGLFVLYAIILTLMLATRLETVGTDTEAYVRFFHDKDFEYHNEKTDFMFEMLGRFIHYFSGETAWFLFFTGVFSMVGIIYLVGKYSLHKSTSLLFFTIGGTTFIFYMLYMSMVRQSCALTFYMLAVCLFFNPQRTRWQLIWSIVFFAMAVLTHGSALFGLPFILVAYFRPITSKLFWYISIIVLYILAGLRISYVEDILQLVFGFLGENKYEGYANVNFGMIEAIAGRSSFFNMLLLPYTLISCALVYISSKEDLKQWWLQLSLMGVAVNNLFNDNLMWGRLMLYLTLFSIVAIPNVLHKAPKMVKVPLYLVFISYFFYKTYRGLLGALVNALIGPYNYEVPYESWLFFDL